ncbi:MAG: hypothetical protein AAGC97_16145 [Planctomycetota bacterium]
MTTSTPSTISMLNVPEMVQDVARSWITYVVVGSLGAIWYLAVTLTTLSSQTAVLQQELMALEHGSVNREIAELRREVDQLRAKINMVGDQWVAFKLDRDDRHQRQIDGDIDKVHRHRDERMSSSRGESI